MHVFCLLCHFSVLFRKLLSWCRLRIDQSKHMAHACAFEYHQVGQINNGAFATTTKNDLRAFAPTLLQLSW